MTLPEVQQNFRTWRENRHHPKEKIPDELWEQVGMIHSFYPCSVICQSLGILKRQFDANVRVDGFASYSLPSTQATNDEQGNCEMSLERGNNRLVIKVPMTQFDRVLSKLTGYLSC
jgi:hypothetical protein